jgi:hypothetical protein
MKRVLNFGLVGFLALGALKLASAETSLQIVPSVFDFGWTPDNALVRCEVHVKNTGGEMVALTAVQPTCGCTATDFTPEGLPASEETKINLTFNTRGYTGMKFDKLVKVKAGLPEEEFSVRLAGHVSDADAVVVPDGNGVVSFPPKSSSKSTVSLKNKSDQPLKLQLVQEPEGWAQVKLPKNGLPANSSADVQVEVKGPLDQDRQTSVTIEAGEGESAHRVTLAIRTGNEPEPYRRIRTAPKASPSSAPASTPKPKKKHS